MKNGPHIDDRFSRAYYEFGTPLHLKWLDVWCIKCPMDMWVYQQVLVDTKPDLVIETGTFMGGSALYLATVMDALGRGEVISVDIESDRDLPVHPRIEFVCGVSSTSPEAVKYVKAVAAGRRCMVILDSAHGKDHVLREIQMYHGLVAKGCYLIVEDTNVHGYEFGPPGDIVDGQGPAEAIKAWQPKNHGFECDRRWEQLMRMSQNPGGMLLRVN